MQFAQDTGADSAGKWQNSGYLTMKMSRIISVKYIVFLVNVCKVPEAD